VTQRAARAWAHFRVTSLLAWRASHYGLSLRNLAASTVLGPFLMACTAMSPSIGLTSAIDATAWVLTTLPGTAVPSLDVPTLRFESGRVQGSDGCNRYNAPYTAVDGRLQIGPNGASTLMACPEPASRLAAFFNAALARVQSYRLDGQSLVLRDAGGATLASFAAQGTALAGTTWQVTAYNNGQQAVVSVRAGSMITMAFMPEGRISGSGGCNSYSGSYTATAGQLAVGPVATTRRACAEPEGVMAQEAAFLRALETVASSRREGLRLELRTPTGALAVTMEQDPAGALPGVSPPR
jgi:heat shock protein HslJ